MTRPWSVLEWFLATALPSLLFAQKSGNPPAAARLHRRGHDRGSRKNQHSNPYHHEKGPGTADFSEALRSRGRHRGLTAKGPRGVKERVNGSPRTLAGTRSFSRPQESPFLYMQERVRRTALLSWNLVY